MNPILEKLLVSIVLVIFIYYWNKYIPRILVSRATGFHKRHNKDSLNTNPIRFFVKHEQRNIKGMQWFYWIGAILVLAGIWFDNWD
jgi:hypothetical protein